MRDTATRKADALAALEKQHDIWLVSSPGYKSLGRRCEQMAGTLAAYRLSDDVVKLRWSSREHLGLTRFAAGSLYAAPVTTTHTR